MKTGWMMNVAVVLLVFTGAGWTAEKAPQSLIEYTHQELLKWSVDPIVVKAVKEDNEKNQTLEEIQKQDKQWQETAGINEFMKSLMVSECGKHLQELMKSKPFFSEIFVMNRLGANVAMTDKTSDFWQGDEDKFKKSYNEGKGEIHFSDVEFDDSAQAYLVQVSIPVKETDPVTKKEKVIGAITIGINMDEFK